MGRGRNRKPRNFATFRLCPRPGAADASDRVFVRVDDNPYSVPGFADDGGGGSGPSSSATVGDDDEPSSSSAEDGGGALPDHVRREILELGLPDDGYDYLPHLRELRPSLSSTGGGGSSAVFLPSRRRPARSGLPVDVKAYDLSHAPVGSGEVAVATRQVEEAIDLDVAKLLDGSDLPAVESGDEEDLEEDFVMLADQSDEEQQIEEEEKNIGGGKGKAQQLHCEQFDSLALEEFSGGEDAVNTEKILVPENAKKKLPKFSSGETSMKKAIIKKGMANLPGEYLSQRKTSSGETSNRGPYKELQKEAEET